jgi:hypothetical protein
LQFDALDAFNRCHKISIPAGPHGLRANALTDERYGFFISLQDGVQVNPEKRSKGNTLFDRLPEGALAELHQEVCNTLDAAKKQVKRSMCLVSQSIEIVGRARQTLKRSDRICLRIVNQGFVKK